MWCELLANYRYRHCLMMADDFPIDHMTNRDRARQRGEKAPSYVNDSGFYIPYKDVPQQVKDAWKKGRRY